MGKCSICGKEACYIREVFLGVMAFRCKECLLDESERKWLDEKIRGGWVDL